MMPRAEDLVTVEEVDAAIREEESRIQKLKTQRERLLSLPEDKQLAEFLHQRKCHSDHTEVCGWFYEIQDKEHNWKGYAHADYLKKARKILKVVDLKTAIELADIM